MLTRPLVARRAAAYFAWLAGFIALCAAIGLVPTVVVFILLFGRIQGRERWRITLLTAFSVGVGCWLIFDRLLALPWPQSLIGALFPALREITGLV